MQTLISSRSRLIRTIITLAISLVGQSCMKRTMTFPSPSHRSTVEVWQRSIENSWGAQAVLVTSLGRKTLVESKRDSFLYFVHVYWSPDETKVGIIGRGAVIWEEAFDITNNRPIPFEGVRADVFRSMAKTYDIPTGMNPVDWSWSSEATTAFFKLHREIHVSYRPEHSGQ
jgi:hypothetical protein